ncbi:hypothetical protein SAMN05421821_10261 [Mucilaginibacter lappiensis]|uniref:Uncharacterized protein n=1 Tax=Mucilaginibacter lappiensis TaxID=354630 RepID=A0ABR6PHH7_9SPHI|nr:hypothetical protein [Mucilaginibacter lappiensis]MBB6108704.1 hypothetical protein [Mucilaginibacter lappiensis]SIQ27150.1 hypothetical protein SAMN05421821_10261 [Mucilaginibacter lappiensis]
MENQQTKPERQSITEMVLRIYVGRFLRKELNVEEMIDIFDLVEKAPDGKSRINILIEKGYARDVTEQQINEAIELVEDYPEFLYGHLTKEAKFLYLLNYRAEQLDKRNLTERVIGLNDAGFLDPTLNASAMICVFDLIEHNDDGKERINRLIEEKCVIGLNQQQIEIAIKLLNDYSEIDEQIDS